MRRSLLLGLAALAFTAACVPAGASTDNGPADRSVISEQEIAASKANDGYSVVRALRPNWLLPATGASSRDEVQVYVEGSKAGSTAVLQRYDANTIRELRWLNGTDATTRYGTGNGAGAILVFLKR